MEMIHDRKRNTVNVSKELEKESESKKKQSGDHRFRISHSLCFVSPLGFEPRTASLEGRCSIQLSYEPKIYGKKKGDECSSP